MPAAIFAVLSLGILFAMFWEGGNNNKLFVLVSDEGIKLPATSRTKFLDWTAIDNMILRFNILTIDCADNSFYQWNINNINFDAAIFEAYCNSKIEEYKAKRLKDW